MVVGRVHPRSEGLVHVLGLEPACELWVLPDAAFEALREAQQGVGAGGPAGGGKRSLVVNLPEKQQRHARLAN